MRVLHLPALVGGHAAGLARAERELGIDSRTLVLEPPPYGYRADRVLVPRGVGPLRRELARWRFALRELRRFDVVHFNFGSTLMPTPHPQARQGARFYATLVRGLDLRLLAAKTAVVVTYQGDDARQASERFSFLPPDYFASDAEKRRAIARFARRADAIFALNPDLLDVLPPYATFLPYASVDPREWPASPPVEEGAFTIAHAPTDREVKGTRHLVEAVDRLRAEGLELELVLVERMTRSAAREAFERSHVVVDQLRTGWYGGVAVEAMALAKPVIAFLHVDDLARVPPELAAELPIVNADAGTIAQTIRELATERRPELAELGRRGRAFVERWHDPRAVARTTVAAYAEAVRRRAMTTTST